MFIPRPISIRDKSLLFFHVDLSRVEKLNFPANTNRRFLVRQRTKFILIIIRVFPTFPLISVRPFVSLFSSRFELRFSSAETSSSIVATTEVFSVRFASRIKTRHHHSTVPSSTNDERRRTSKELNQHFLFTIRNKTERNQCRPLSSR